MKKDAEVRLMMRERSTGKTQEQAAARARMGLRTGRKCERMGKLPGELKVPGKHRTRNRHKPYLSTSRFRETTPLQWRKYAGAWTGCHCRCRRCGRIAGSRR